jgi:UDP-N-acetylglucosamine 2-epimerase
MKIVTIVGARPQFIKAAAVSRAIAHHNRHCSNEYTIKETMVHTGQHYDENMSEVFFRELHLPKPDYFLEINSLSHGAMAGRMLEKIESVLQKETPDWVMVYGDTNSTLAGALAAVKLHIPVAHVEAGLRSFNRRMPEEINRVLTDHMATLLLCPTDTAVENLKAEGILNGVYNTGDVMYDAFLFNRQLSENGSVILSTLDLTSRSYCLATIHRAENTDNPRILAQLFGALQELGTGTCPIVLPIHPRTKKLMESCRDINLKGSDVRIISPVSYLDMISLEINARIILTDSGGMQKEALFAQVPCVTLRNETEWVETVACGWNYLGGTTPDSILNAFQCALAMDVARSQPNFYGNGDAGNAILKYISSAQASEFN